MLVNATTIPRKFNQWSEYIGLVFNLILAGQYLYIWLFPQPDDGNKLYGLTLLILFEFVMVHSGVFMAVFPAKVSLFIFFPFYGLFALGFTLAIKDLSIVILYLAIVLNRMRFAFFNTDKNLSAEMILRSVISAAGYFILLIITAICQSLLPQFGLTEAFLQSIQYESITTRSGGDYLPPVFFTCLGVLYYLFLSYVDYRMMRKKVRRLLN